MTTDHLCPLPSPSHQPAFSDIHLYEPIGSVVARLPWVRDAVVPSPAPAPTPLTVLAPTLPPAESPLAVLFTAFGRDAACLVAARSGQSFGCCCEGRSRGTDASALPLSHSYHAEGCKSFAEGGLGDDDEAVAHGTDEVALVDGPIDPSLVAGLSLRYGHMLKGRGLFLPRGLSLALADLVATGDPTAQIIWEWCLEHNLIGDVGASAGLVLESKAKPEPERAPAPPPPSPTLRLVTTGAVRP